MILTSAFNNLDTDSDCRTHRWTWWLCT